MHTNGRCAAARGGPPVPRESLPAASQSGRTLFATLQNTHTHATSRCVIVTNANCNLFCHLSAIFVWQSIKPWRPKPIFFVPLPNRETLLQFSVAFSVTSARVPSLSAVVGQNHLCFCLNTQKKNLVTANFFFFSLVALPDPSALRSHLNSWENEHLTWKRKN